MWRVSVTETLAHDSQTWQAPLLATGRVRPRVLQVGKYYYPHLGGMETHLHSLCSKLRKSVHLEVLVANETAATKREAIEGVAVTRLGTPFSLASAPICPSLRTYIKEAEADLVHIHLPNPTALLSYLASGHRGRLVITYHSDIIRQKFLGRAFWPFLKRGLERADAIIVGSPNYMETSPVLCHFTERCHVIPFGIPLEPFSRPNYREVKMIRQQYGKRLVLAVGRLVYYKGFEYLVRAMKDVEAHLLIVGNGPLEAKLRAVIQVSGVSNKVTILNDVQDVIPYYQAAEVFVLPSVARSEAFGIVQLEAMACGKPVVNTQLDSGVPFVSLHDVTGCTVPPNNSEALAQAINSLLKNPALRAKYGLAGQQRVNRQFSLETMANDTLRLYDRVLSAK